MEKITTCARQLMQTFQIQSFISIDSLERFQILDKRGVRTGEKVVLQFTVYKLMLLKLFERIYIRHTQYFEYSV